MADEDEKKEEDYKNIKDKESYSKSLEGVKYHNTTLNIFLLVNGDLNIYEKIKFDYNMIKKIRASPTYFFLLKNKIISNNIIENAGYDVNDYEIFSKIDKFENIKDYVDEQKSETPNEDIKDNINKNIDFMLKYFFPYKREITLRNKQYIITKYKMLDEKGFVHLNKDDFFDITYNKVENTPIFKETKLIDLLKSKINLIDAKKDRLTKDNENSYIDSINITIDLTVLDKSKNLSKYDFIKSNCTENTTNLRKAYGKVIFSLFGVKLKKDDKEEQRKRDQIRFHYKYDKKKVDTQSEIEKKIQDKFFRNLFGKEEKEKEEKEKEEKEKMEKEAKEKEEKEAKEKMEKENKKGGGKKNKVCRRTTRKYRKKTTRKCRKNTRKHNRVIV